MAKRYLAGTVLRPQGVKGEIKVKPETDRAERFLDLKKVFVNEEETPRKVLRCRLYDGGAFLFLEGINDRTQAEKLRGAVLYADKEERITPGAGAFFIADIVGLPVYSGAEFIGKLTNVLKYGAADVFEIDGGRVMFPHVEGIIAAVNEDKIVLNDKEFEKIAVFNES